MKCELVLGAVLVDGFYSHIVETQGSKEWFQVLSLFTTSSSYYHSVIIKFHEDDDEGDAFDDDQDSIEWLIINQSLPINHQ